MSGSNDPSGSADLAAVMSRFKASGVDWEVVVAGQRRNMEALAKASRVVVEAMQQVTQRHAEILRQNIEEASKLLAFSCDDAAPVERVERHSALVRATVENALGSMREMTELVTKANRDAFEVLNSRVAAGMEELRAAAPQLATPQPGPGQPGPGKL